LLNFNALSLAWVTLGIVAAIVEVSIPHFGIAFVGVAAIAAAFVAYFDFTLVAQLATFVVVLGVSLVFLRPRLLKRLDAPGVPSRTAALIGRDAVVTHDIEQIVGAGRVNVGGQDWAARASQPIPAGTRVRIIGADGIVLEVRPL
jgi:membrane protein implicated in regulation of membrane protease activity